jgi:hypothetical protein
MLTVCTKANREFRECVLQTVHLFNTGLLVTLPAALKRPNFDDC